MKLADDFSVRKVMSVREELWMTDGDWAKMCCEPGSHVDTDC